MLSKGNGVLVLYWDVSTPRIEVCFPALPIVEAFSTAIDDRYFTDGMAFYRLHSYKQLRKIQML
jgi:hypothetical protein